MIERLNYSNQGLSRTYKHDFKRHYDISLLHSTFSFFIQNELSALLMCYFRNNHLFKVVADNDANFANKL